MIVLPNTPPLPVPVSLLAETPISARISAKRLFLPSNPVTYSDCVSYTVSIENYIDDVFQILSEEVGNESLTDLANLAAKTIIYRGQAPWNDVVYTPAKKMLRFGKPNVEWTLAQDISMSLISVALMCTKLGANLINDLIDMEPDDVDAKWKMAGESYKKGLEVLAFTTKFISTLTDQGQVNPLLIPALEKVCHIGIQVSTLCKSSWMNRISFENREPYSSKNNGVLCRVAIWVMNEVGACQSLFRELDSQSSERSVSLNCSGWVEYSEVFLRYVTAYSGLFLSVEYYQKEELGQAIGLIHFSLLTLQAKSILTSSGKAGNYKKLKDKFVGKKNDNFVTDLSSLTTLQIDKSVFRGSSSTVLNDLNYLFDELVSLRLKYTKENESLKFEPVVDWKDVKSDTRWPVGTRIPTTRSAEYFPKVLEKKTDGFNPDFNGQYF